METLGGARILILSGSGPFADPWHPMAETSAVLAAALQGVGSIVIRYTEPGVLDDIADFDLVVLNIGAPPLSDDVTADIVDNPIAHSARAALLTGLISWTRCGGRILAVHQTLLAAEKHPSLAEVLGANWVTGVSGHPPIGDLTLKIDPNVLPTPYQTLADLLGAVSKIPMSDERYFGLRYAPEIVPFGFVTLTDPELASVGLAHLANDAPAVWEQTAHGGSTIVSSLGHDARCYASAAYCSFLQDMAKWLLTCD